MSKYVVAIDLGTTKVVSLVGEKLDDEHYRIVAYSEEPSNGIRRGQVEHITKVVNAVVPTLDKIKTDAKIDNIENVYVGIAGQHITCIENRVEKIRDKYDEIITREEIMELEAKAGKLHLNPDTEILHVIPQNYSIDGQTGITDPVGRLGNKLTGHFYVVIGNKSNRIHTNSCLKALNLSLNKLILEPIASARAVLSNDEKELGVAMIDIGGGTTDLIVYKDYTIVHTAVIPFGGNVITEDIKTMCSIKYEQAEQIKVKFGLQAKPHEYVQVEGISGREPRQLSFDIILKVITSRLNEIIDMVLYEIVNKTQCGKLGAGIVITGGVSKMKGIKEFLIKRLKEQAELEPEIKHKIETEVIISSPQYILHDYDSGKDTIIHPKYSTAVGLVMCGFDHLESLELTPEQKEAQQKREEEERLKREEEQRRKQEEEERLKREEERLKREEEQRRQEEEWRKKGMSSWLKNAVKDVQTFLKAQKDEKND
ncbi:MAG: cell division protein FtsA [Prevotellaceae bacterium]|jgi:cell division protein FtsA|nr:cell division protein FtsA [Prevotellaceae bacterium]